MNRNFRMSAVVKAIEDALAEPNGSFEAVISAPTLDRDGEVIDPGAFDPLPKSIPILADHEGMVRSLVARAVPFYDGGVLKVRGTYASHEFAQYVRGLVQENILDTMSVGFMPPVRKMVDGTPHITKSELLEASFVVIPSNRDALVTAAKAVGDKQFVDIEPMAGSYEDTQEALRSSLSALYGDMSWVSVMATFGDRCVFSVESFPSSETDGSFEVTYTLSDDGTVSLDVPTAVEVQQVLSPKTLANLALKATRTNRQPRLTNSAEMDLSSVADSVVLDLDLMEMGE